MGIIFGIVTLLFAFYVFLFASQGMRLPGSKYLIYLFPGDLAPLCFRNCTPELSSLPFHIVWIYQSQNLSGSSQFEYKSKKLDPFCDLKYPRLLFV